MSSRITEADLQQAHTEVIQYLGGFMQNLRAPKAQYNCRRDEVLTFFRKLPLWQEVRNASGHAIFKHKVTGVVVGLQAHGGNTVNPTQMNSILEGVQKHINKLGNDILGIGRGWRTTVPDYRRALERLH